MRNLLATTALIGGLALAGPAANAATILTFAQVGTADTITGTANAGGTQTTITGSLAVLINGIAGPDSGSTPIAATLTLNAMSVGTATGTLVGSPPVLFVDQSFSGTFSITGAGHNYLTGSFADATFGSGPSLTLSVGTATGETISFTSDQIPASDLLPPLGMSLSFANVNPPVGLDNTTLASFGASVTGDFSAAVPEPASLAVLGVGLLGLGFVANRKRSN